MAILSKNISPGVQWSDNHVARCPFSRSDISNNLNQSQPINTLRRHAASLIDITSLNNLYNINQIWAQTESWTLPRWRAEDWFRQQQQRLCFERAILKNIWARVRKIFLDRLQEWRELTVAYIYLMVGVIMGQEVCVTICENIYSGKQTLLCKHSRHYPPSQVKLGTVRIMLNDSCGSTKKQQNISYIKWA